MVHRFYQSAISAAIVLFLASCAWAQVGFEEHDFGQHVALLTGDTGAADGPGFERTPINAQGDPDDGVAEDRNSGSSTCDTFGDPACTCGLSNRDQHTWWEWNFTVPSGAYGLGLRVKFRGRSDNSTSAPREFFDFSLDGGATWTSECKSISLGNTLQNYVLPVATGDDWGLVLTPSAVNNNITFRLRRTSAATSGARDFFADSVKLEVNWIENTPTPTVTATGTLPTPTITPTNTPTVAIGGTFHVTSTADLDDNSPGDGYCNTNDSPCGADSNCTLRAAIQEANALAGTDSIILDPGEYNLERADDGLEVTSVMTIDGLGTNPDHALNRAEVIINIRGNSTRFMSVLSGGVTLSDVYVHDLRNRLNTNSIGGCFYNASGATSTLDNVELDDCDNMRTQAELAAGNGSKGGAIHNAGTITLRNGSLIQTGVSNWGGCAFNSGTATAIDTEFDGCHTQGLDQDTNGEGDSAGGGAGWFNIGTLTLTRWTCDYCRNRLGIGGGGILNGDNQGTTVMGSPDTGPTDLGGGGTITMTNATFVENRCRRCELGALASYGGTITGKYITISRTQAYGISAVGFKLNTTFTCDGCIIEGSNISVPSSGYPNCYDDGTTTFNITNSMDDSDDPSVNPITCSGFTAKEGLCLEGEGLYGGTALIEIVPPKIGGCTTTVDGKSPAIDAGPAGCGLTTDAKSDVRPINVNCDIGAVEIQ